MGLPAESLEFLTRGAKFSKPPLLSTLKNVPGLVRLLAREWQLETDFNRDRQKYFLPCLEKVSGGSLEKLPKENLLENIETLLRTLRIATYYSILAPLSFALRKSIFKVGDRDLDNSLSPEVASLESLKNIADQIRPLVPRDLSPADLEKWMKNTPEEGKKFQRWLDDYGYLGAVGTDIAVSRWRDDSEPMQKLLIQLVLNPSNKLDNIPAKPHGLQKRLNIKNQTTEIYSQLLSHLRWNFLALERVLINKNILSAPGEIFYLNYNEIENIEKVSNIKEKIETRKEKYEENLQLSPIPYVVYGNPPKGEFLPSKLQVKEKIEGIGASPGQIEGKIKVMKTLEIVEMEPNTILVVPYTDSGWSPLLSKVSGIIAEVGGQLSHGAIIAREYGIPAVMDVNHATELFKDGQIVRLDGQKGSVEILKF
jgi:pyruvate,water dikinase